MTQDEMKNLDFEFLLDKSGSMEAKDCKGGKSRWAYGQEAISALATKAEAYDSDGITVVPFASWDVSMPKSTRIHEGVTAAKVAEVFKEHEPNGSTNTAGVLQARLNAYLERKAKGSTKPLLAIVMTDGEPTDKEAVKKVISDFTKKISSRKEAAIQFIQVGSDAAAKTFLEELDDGLTSGTYKAAHDIVDTMTVDELENYTFSELVEKSFSD